MSLIEPKFCVMNKRYVGIIKLDDYYYKNDIYEYYKLNTLKNLPLELIEKIMSFICSSLIITYQDNCIQFINSKDNKIVKEFKLNKELDTYNNIMSISNDGLRLITAKYEIVHIEYLYNTENQNDYNHNLSLDYSFNIMGEVVLSPSTTYFIKCDKTQTGICIICVYNTITKKNVKSYTINANYISYICFSPDENKIAVISSDINNTDDVNLHVFDNNECIYNESFISTNYILSWNTDSKILLINELTDGFHYTNATYSKMLNIETKEIIQSDIIYFSVEGNVRWKNNNTFSYIQNEHLIISDMNTQKSNKISLNKYNLYDDFNIVDFYYTFDEQFIGLFENNFGDLMILF